MVRDVTRPDVDAKQAASIAARLFAWSGSIEELPSERDRNFLIRDGQATAVLKVANATTSPDDLALQAAAMHAVAMRPGVRSPTLIPTVDGDLYGEVALPGGSHLARLVTYVPGTALGAMRPKRLETLREVGAAARATSRALSAAVGLDVPAGFAWDLSSAAATIARDIHHVTNPDSRRLLELVVTRAAEEMSGLWAELSSGVIHGDLNDHNVLVGETIGVIDFGDVHASVQVAEVAVAAAYACFGFVDAVDAIAAVVSGAHGVDPLTGSELAAVVPLAALRLALSVVAAAQQTAADPTNAYLAISRDDAWDVLAGLAAYPWQLAVARLRSACGLDPDPRSLEVAAWLDRHPENLSPVLGVEISTASAVVVDWSVGSPLADHPDVAPPVTVQAERTARMLDEAGAEVGIGRYGEPRLVYSAPEFSVATNDGPAWRTVHLGVDLSCSPGTTVHALLAAEVERIDHDTAVGGYGPVVTLRHEPEPGVVFYSLYGHLSATSIEHLAVGQRVGGGAVIAGVGETHENGHWPPHLHFQLMVDLFDFDGPFPGVAEPSQWATWSGVCPSPAAALRLPAAMVDAASPAEDAIVARRADLLPKSLSTAYDRPLVAVRGHGVWLYDGWGRAHLDCVNNVAHVGHEHPHVVAALRRQAALLNTNSRYPHPERVRYVERLAATFPEPLDTVFLVCSGSEANDLALRIARTVTARDDILVVDGAYHGHTAELIRASPYKHAGPGGAGRSANVHVLPVPDPYRSPHGDDTPGHLGNVESTLGSSPPVAAMLVEPLLGVAGQIVPPAGYLRGAAALVRDAGGLVIADEVQVGLGRVGTHWWAFDRDGATPDIVTVGKPLGNGHPMAALVTTRRIADAFANGMEYFNTFGGNPVSCAVGNAVLDVIEAEGLMDRATTVGARLRAALSDLGERHEVVGDVRGVGMFIGLELVLDRESKRPAAAQAAYVVERAREMGVLLSTDGIFGNVIKIKPPLVFGDEHLERLVSTFAVLLAEDGAAGSTRP